MNTSSPSHAGHQSSAAPPNTPVQQQQVARPHPQSASSSAHGENAAPAPESPSSGRDIGPVIYAHPNAIECWLDGIPVPFPPQQSKPALRQFGSGILDYMPGVPMAKGRGQHLAWLYGRRPTVPHRMFPQAAHRELRRGRKTQVQQRVEKNWEYMDELPEVPESGSLSWFYLEMRLMEMFYWAV
ncbi:hypothetical protein GQ43DRAFT_468410 [Delitschia confertaspora ATCC 74209]|uniref:Uncharacterized protein n=1 Tax=Delitschia confertaspora ATCC 74209 TaxID=1513339 RepID=A0A9P4MVW4_9PLEO|nr:hypothetical protein GQ43DRAFT_468410 [Delitschia confertaspora ATCC 74209]